MLLEKGKRKKKEENKKEKVKRESGDWPGQNTGINACGRKRIDAHHYGVKQDKRQPRNRK